MTEIKIQVTSKVDDASIDVGQLSKAIRNVLDIASIMSAQIGVVIVDAAEIHELNRRYLNHDYPTDVLSFPLMTEDGHLEGDIAVSIDAARDQASQYDWSAGDELLLYVIHGTLHLVGYDDHNPADARRMRAKECEVLAEFGMEPHYDQLPEGSTSNPMEDAP